MISNEELAAHVAAQETQIEHDKAQMEMYRALYEQYKRYHDVARDRLNNLKRLITERDRDTQTGES